MLVHSQTSWGGAVIPSAFLYYAYAHQLNAITYIHLFLSIILTLSGSRPIIQFGINISTSVSHRCSPLFIGIHLFIHSLSHLASEGLTWRSLRPSKVKVKEPTSLAKLLRTLLKAHNSKQKVQNFCSGRKLVLSTYGHITETNKKEDLAPKSTSKSSGRPLKDS